MQEIHEENILEVKGVSKRFGENDVLNDIGFRIRKGEFVAVMGRSGCGKSTLLYSISGMDQPTNGEVLFEGQKMSGYSTTEMEKLRLNHMGFIFQKANFMKTLSVMDNIIFPAFWAGKKSRQEIVQEAEKLMEQMDILSVADHDIRRVSGGQLQRASICRAMINHPDILFGDEPTGALNSSATKEVMDILGQINLKGTTVFLVTHDAKVAARAERIIYLEDGRIKEECLLGKCSQKTLQDRENKLREWLEKQGF